MRGHRAVLRALGLTMALALTGCARGCTSSRPPIHINPSMDRQPKVLPQSASQFFYNGASMQVPVAGTVAQGELRDDPAFYEGRTADGGFVATSPVPVNEELIERGHERYKIYCQPCHDARGFGKGILFQRASVPTASLHDEKIVNYPDGQIFDVITNGSGLMPAYRWPIPPRDRWAIIAWVRRLQQGQPSARQGDTP
jgi:mono/diheme cytochrome c family protein